MKKIIILIIMSTIFVSCNNSEPVNMSQKLSENEPINKYKLIKEFPDGSKLVEYQLKIVYKSNLEARLNVTTAGVSFEDGTIDKIIPLNDESNSLYKYRLIISKGIPHADHRIQIFQDNIPIAHSYLIH